MAPVEPDLQRYSICEFSWCKTGLFGQSSVGRKTFYSLFPLFCPLLGMGTIVKSRSPHPFIISPFCFQGSRGMSQDRSCCSVTQWFPHAQPAPTALSLQGCHEEERADPGEDNVRPTHSFVAKVPANQLARRCAAGLIVSLPSAVDLSVPRRWHWARRVGEGLSLRCLPPWQLLPGTWVLFFPPTD